LLVEGSRSWGAGLRPYSEKSAAASVQKATLPELLLTPGDPALERTPPDSTFFGARPQTDSAQWLVLRVKPLGWVVMIAGGWGATDGGESA
jgi:hypothetical protein